LGIKKGRRKTFGSHTMNRAQGLDTVEIRTKQCIGALKPMLKNTVRQQCRRKAVRTRDSDPVPFE
jgi:hypothetical protein